MTPKWVRATLLLAALGAFAFISRNPQLFGWATFCVSIFILGSIELDRNKHELSFYYHEAPKEIVLRWIRSFGIFETAVKSIVFGLLASFLLSGRTAPVRLEISNYFVVSVMAGYLVLLSFRRVKGLDVVRWSYTRCAVLLGLTFSVLMARVHDVSYIALGNLLMKAERGTLDTPYEIARLVHGVTHKLNGHLLEDALASAFGSDFVGSTVSFFLTTDVVFGFVVLPYSVLLLFLTPSSPSGGAPKTTATSAGSSANNAQSY
jgi:hypothetical protein